MAPLRHPDIMNKVTKIVLGLLVLTLISLVGSWVISEIRWRIINNPSGKFTTTREYLAIGRLPREVHTIDFEGEPYWIAYGSLDTWMAAPSGSPAYVFDSSGIIRDWTNDIGDDQGFQMRWTGRPKQSSIAELQALSDGGTP